MKSGLDKTKYLEPLRKILIFRSLSDQDLERLLPYIDIISYEEKGVEIITEGDIGPSFFGVLKGTVVVQVKQGSHDVYLCSIGEGDIFGETAMFMKMKRTATVLSTEGTIVFRMVRNDMLNFFDKNPRHGNRILMIMVYSLLKKLRESNQELAFERKSDVEQADIDALLQEMNSH